VGALKEGRGELLLECLEAGRERRLADRKNLCSAAHVPEPGDFDEAFDLSQEHRSRITCDRND
jgi:hypothetical protein